MNRCEEKISIFNSTMDLVTKTFFFFTDFNKVWIFIIVANLLHNAKTCLKKENIIWFYNYLRSSQNKGNQNFVRLFLRNYDSLKYRQFIQASTSNSTSGSIFRKLAFPLLDKLEIERSPKMPRSPLSRFIFQTPRS